MDPHCAQILRLVRTAREGDAHSRRLVQMGLSQDHRLRSTGVIGVAGFGYWYQQPELHPNLKATDCQSWTSKL